MRVAVVVVRCRRLRLRRPLGSWRGPERTMPCFRRRCWCLRRGSQLHANPPLPRRFRRRTTPTPLVPREAVPCPRTARTPSPPPAYTKHACSSLCSTPSTPSSPPRARTLAAGVPSPRHLPRSCWRPRGPRRAVRRGGRRVGMRGLRGGAGRGFRSPGGWGGRWGD